MPYHKTLKKIPYQESKKQCLIIKLLKKYFIKNLKKVAHQEP